MFKNYMFVTDFWRELIVAWQERFWHEAALPQVVWLLACFLVGFGLMRILFDDLLQKSLSRLHEWLAIGKPDRNSNLLLRLIELRLLLVTQFLVWIGVRIFTSNGEAVYWLTLAQNLMIGTVVVLTFRGYFHSKGVARIFIGIVLTVSLINGMGLFDHLLFWVEKDLFSYGDTAISLLSIFKVATILFVGFWLVDLTVGGFTGSINRHFDVSSSFGLLISKVARIGLCGLVGLIAIESLGIRLQSLSFFAGAIGLGLGLGLQRLVANLASGMVLLADKSVKPGDFIEFDGRKGIVCEMTSRAVRITDLKNIDYIIPNEKLIEQTIINWSHDSQAVWMFVVIGVDYATDLDQAMDLMKTAAKSQPGLSKQHGVNCFVKAFADSSIELLVSFVVEEPRKGYFGIMSNIRYSIWRLFKEHNITIPFPQSDVHIHQTSINPVTNTSMAPKKHEKES